MLPAGTRVRQYQIIRELGRGGMGCVFLARDTRLGRRVAMKFLLNAQPDVAGRFLREARATARCNHENIVVIHEVDTHRGMAYMVLEYLEGSSLARMIAGRALPAGQAAELMVPVVRALARAHDDGIVHRDLKPENIFVTASGTIKVLDFGIAKIFADREGGIREAPAVDAAAGLQSLPAGTLPYMAPEQLGMDADPRTDIWAVGMILHEMLTGAHPLHGLGADEIVKTVLDLDRPLPRLAPPAVPEAMANLVARCLAKRRGQRYPSARALLADLEPLVPRRGARPLAEDECPFPGLEAYQEDDADRFFGRSAEVAQMVGRLARHPIAGLVGPSGVGKSSFVLAGLVPALKATGDPWQALVVRPGRRPLASLARLLQDASTPEGSALVDTEPALGTRAQAERAATTGEAELRERMRAEPGTLGARLRERAARTGCRILVFVDQLEELHTLGASPEERAAFVASLAALADDASGPLRLVVAVRSDFLDRIASDGPFADELARGLAFLRPLDAEALREALVRPLELGGYRFESDDIVEEMLAAVQGVAGALPLLQFAAAKLWEGRDVARRLVGRATYAAMGGVSGAFAAHADAVLQAMPRPQQQLARRVAVRLVTSERTRAVVDLSELRALSTAAEVDSLVEQLAAARLIVVQTRDDVEGPTVELVHDSLVESWPALRRWLEESKEETAFLTELRAAARQWDARGRKPGMLWRGEAMEEARLWRARHRVELGQREAEFLRAVFALASRSARIRRGVIAATITVLLGVVAAGAVALVSIRQARTRAVDAAAQAQREADRARDAEQRVKDQLSVIESEQQKRQKADVAVERGEKELRVVNGELEQALARAQAESQRARASAATAQDLAESLRSANGELQRLLAAERVRSERLEKERKKITTELR